MVEQGTHNPLVVGSNPTRPIKGESHMKLNFRPTKVAYLDFETQSEQELTTVGKYSKHLSTKALTCCVKVDGKMLRMGPYLTATDIACLHSIAEQYTLVAHNAPFDAAIWENVLKLPEVEWFDTLPCARAAGLPGGLDKLSKAVGGRGKHKDGERLIQMLCCVRNGKVPAVGPAHKLLLEYNAQDVEELEVVYERVKNFGEPEVMTVDRIMNNTGIKIDRSLLLAILDMYEQNSKKAESAYAELTGGINPRSPIQVKEWLNSQGFLVESTNKFAMNNLIADPENFYCGNTDDGNSLAEHAEAMREAVELRREVAGIGKGKADAALESLDDDDYIRDLLIIYGAHTGRWASRKLQIHNLPGRIKGLDVRHVEPTLEALIATAKTVSEKTGVNVPVADCIGSMLRRLVKAENLLVADYSAVEARCLAWVCDCKMMLARYSDPHSRSLYLDMGKTVFQREISKTGDPAEYVVAKALFLGAGYGMSGAKFEARLSSQESRATIEKFRNSGVTAKDAVKAYRTLFPEIPEMWKKCGDAVMQAVAGTSSEIAKCFIHMVGADLRIVLPSGRPFIYRNARIEMVVPMYCKMYGMPEIPIPTVVFDGQKGLGYLYGSKIVENICQAICRDLLADATVQCYNAGLNPILHVHDELACEAPEERFNEMLSIMTLPPSWADGFPVKVEGYSGTQWSKVADGYLEKTMQTGVLL